MSMSAFARVLNSRPKPNSKKQQRLKEELIKRPIQYVVCNKCKRQDVTLHKVEKGYLCTECMKGAK